MSRYVSAAIITASLWSCSTEVAAQPAEVGVGVGVMHVARSDWFDQYGRSGVQDVGLDGRLTLPINARFSIEPYATLGRRTVPAGQEHANAVGSNARTFEGTFGVNVKHLLVRTDGFGFHAFFTYGLIGAFTREASRSRTLPPFSPAAGIGVQKTLGRHVAVRTNVDAVLFAVLPIGDFNEGAAGGIRASASAVIPFGHYELK